MQTKVIESNFKSLDVMLEGQRPVPAPQLHKTAVNNHEVNDQGKDGPDQRDGNRACTDKARQGRVHAAVAFAADGDVAFFAQPHVLQHKRTHGERQQDDGQHGGTALVVL